MKKLFAGLTLALMLGIAPMAGATETENLWSPSGHRIPPPEDPDRSPKTGDINIHIIEGIGAAAVVVAVVSRKKRYA